MNGRMGDLLLVRLSFPCLQPVSASQSPQPSCTDCIIVSVDCWLSSAERERTLLDKVKGTRTHQMG
eukprot:scaffold511517_cov24-Prasinocladus_malaysianus.AAC.1